MGNVCLAKNLGDVKWICTRDYEGVCTDISSRWGSLRKGVIDISNNIEGVEQIQVPMLVFERMEHVSKKGKKYIK